jgi:subtilisin family serine protease
VGSVGRVRTVALAGVMAGAMVTGVVTASKAQSTPASEAQSAPGVASGTASAVGGVAQDRAGTSAGAQPVATVTLITGDRVAVGSDGQVVELIRGKGREKIGFSVRREAGHTYVVPQDALRPIADGLLDRQLFDVAQLVENGYDDAHRGTLPLIVGYRRDGAKANPSAPARDRFAGVAVRERRALPAVDGEAFDAAKTDAPALWAAVTGRSPAPATGGAAAPERPLAHVWLDAKVRATLAESVPQIGAPVMWKSGYTGKGVKVAILDSGVDQTHPDLKGLEIAQKNFSGAPDVKDRFGHGTHVASIVAGSGAQSGGRYKGVAPDVKLLDGKVLADDGFGDISGIVAGMQWAVDQGAQIVNMSLGGGDEPGLDPMEAAVARLSGKALFVVSAGNKGGDGPGTIQSPGSAPAALTVGAVDKQDQLGDFSSLGPNRDGTPKPDISGPGVEITAALTTQSEQPSGEGYVAQTGTSMAAPHVAGAAALLLQQHPDWSGARLKTVLTGSAKPNPRLHAYQQGAGRVDLKRASTALVAAEPGSLGFGLQSWPHTDDKPVAKTLAYRNLGTRAVTLQLTVAATNPSGGPAPAGMFTIRDTQLTVPAGGTAKTTVTADTRKGTADGVFGGTVLASGDGQEVRTGLVVEREVESYDVTVRHIDADGANAQTYATVITRRDGDGGYVELPSRPNGTVVQRLRKGTYHLESQVFAEDNELGFFVQPVLDVTKDVKVTLDSRKAKPLAVKAPDKAAKLVTSVVSYYDEALGSGNSWFTDGVPPIRTAALGPASPTLRAQYNGVWKRPGAAGKNVDYRLAFNRKGSFFTGLDHTVTRAEVAEVKLGYGASVTGAKGRVHIRPLDELGNGMPLQEPSQQKLPLSTTRYLSTAGVRWSWTATQLDARSEARMIYRKERVTYKPGSSQTLKFNTAVVGPDLPPGGLDGQGAERTGDTISAMIPLFTDSSGHPGFSAVTGGVARLESGGRILGEGPATDMLTAEVPAASAAYRLTVEAKRSTADTSTSTKVAGVWTFTSARPAPNRTVALPLSAVRFTPKLSLSGTAPAGGTLTVPLKVRGAAAAAGQVAALTVKVSFDGGRTWRTLAVKTDAKGARSVSVKHPASAKAVSFVVDLKDKSGNTVRQTITNAYRLAK